STAFVVKTGTVAGASCRWSLRSRGRKTRMMKMMGRCREFSLLPVTLVDGDECGLNSSGLEREGVEIEWSEIQSWDPINESNQLQAETRSSDLFPWSSRGAPSKDAITEGEGEGGRGREGGAATT